MPGQFNIRQLEAFYWIMRLGGFGMAAQKLGATQPAVSARIKELEQSLGASLFERGSKVFKADRISPNALSTCFRSALCGGAYQQ